MFTPGSTLTPQFLSQPQKIESYNLARLKWQLLFTRPNSAMYLLLLAFNFHLNFDPA